jgi:hypothetical protein
MHFIRTPNLAGHKMALYCFSFCSSAGRGLQVLGLAGNNWEDAT